MWSNSATLTDVSTRRCSPEAEEFLLDCRKIDDEKRKRTCPQEHLDKIRAICQGNGSVKYRYAVVAMGLA